jgi:hypothetical protein
MKNALLLDFTPCGSRWNQRFGGTYLRYNQGGKNLRTRHIRSAVQLLVIAKFPSMLILSAPIMEAIYSSETFGLTRAI